MGSDIHDDAELTKDCEAAAYRAGQVHKWLEAVLRQSAAADHAYAFKGRVKSADDIWNKVRGYRNHEDSERRRLNYAPQNVTDVSGFRIVKLFNAEVPEALNQLFSLLKTTLPPGEPKGRLKEVKEIEFHTSRLLNDPLSIHTEVKRVVESHGFKLKAHEPGQGTASSYSSVHVLLECEVHGSSGVPISACSEIQLRSVFEEAWGEISHRLKYAPAKLARASGSAPIGKDEPFADAFLHLDALKSLTDGCAQYADLINRQLQNLATERAERKPSPLDPAEKSAAKFAGCGEALRQAVEQAYRMRTEAVSAIGEAERASAYQQAATAFQAALEVFPERTSADQKRLFDVLREELAFCYMFAGNEELRNRAEKIYRELLVAWPDRVSVLLRLGQLRRDSDSYAEAKELLEKGLAAAEKNPDPESEAQRQASWLLRRDLAYICWRIVDLDPARPDAVLLLRRAIELSEEALAYARTEEQQLLVDQNLLYYLADLWERLPTDQKLDPASKGYKLLTEIRPKVDLKAWSIEELDSLVRAEAAFGEPARAESTAKVISERLAERIAKIRQERSCSRAQAFEALSRDDRDMYLYAQDLLAIAGH